MKRLLFTFAFTCSLFPLKAQETLTLEQCIRMGIENNLSLQTKRNDIVKGEHSISENRAKLLPQINAVVAMNDNFNPPVSVTDGSAYGNPYNVTKTLQYNASAGLQLQMPLYNQTLLTALDITKMMDRINRLSYDKARNDLIEQISSMYYLAQSTVEQIDIVKANITRLEELKNITEAFFDNGMAMEVDVKRVNINLENLQVQHDNAKAMLTQQLNMLKYVIDYPADSDIRLTAVIPFRGQSCKFNPADKERYRSILGKADDMVCLSETYFDGCFLRRNDYMLERASHIIAYYNGEPKGGTFYTCRRAKRMNLEITNLY